MPAVERLVPVEAVGQATATGTVADADRWPLPLLHRDARLIAVHKPAGLLVHRSALDAHAEHDALTLLRERLDLPLWPVHRLDKGTSGVLLFARDVDAARRLGAAFAGGRTHKRYRALVRGWPAEHGLCTHPLARDPERPSAGQPQLEACTSWQRLACLEVPLRTSSTHERTRLALLALSPRQGRRHQIRRHAKHIGHPLIGDSTHGKGPLNRTLATWYGLNRLWLHAALLDVPHPDDAARRLRLEAPPGPEWADWERWTHPDGPAGSAGSSNPAHRPDIG